MQLLHQHNIGGCSNLETVKSHGLNSSVAVSLQESVLEDRIVHSIMDQTLKGQMHPYLPRL